MLDKQQRAEFLGRQAAEFNLMSFANRKTICPYETSVSTYYYMQAYNKALKAIKDGELTQKQYTDLPSVSDAKEGETGYFLTVPTQFIPSKVVCQNHL